jgi:hypothetical protein
LSLLNRVATNIKIIAIIQKRDIRGSDIPDKHEMKNLSIVYDSEMNQNDLEKEKSD